MNRQQTDGNLLPRSLVVKTYKRKLTKSAFYEQLPNYDLLYVLLPMDGKSFLNSMEEYTDYEQAVLRFKDGSGLVFTDVEAAHEGEGIPEDAVMMGGHSPAVLRQFQGSGVLVNPFSDATVSIPARKVQELAKADVDDRGHFSEQADELIAMMQEIDGNSQEADETLELLENLKTYIESEDENALPDGGLLDFQKPKHLPKALIDAVKKHLSDINEVRSAYYTRVKMPAFISPHPIEMFAVEIEVDDPDAFYDELADVAETHLNDDQQFDMSILNEHSDPDYRDLLIKHSVKIL